MFTEEKQLKKNAFAKIELRSKEQNSKPRAKINEINRIPTNSEKKKSAKI